MSNIHPPLLSEQQFKDFADKAFSDYMADLNDDADIALARAIESATRAPLLARIAELEEINGQLCGQNSVVDAACAEYEKVYAEALASLKAAVIERDEARVEVDRLRAQVAATHTEQPIQAGEVVQFRKRWCSDWYDGHPDHEDGGGPYETRTLYTAPPKPVPMTPEEMMQACRDAQIAFCLDKFTDYDIALIRTAEAHRRITSKGE
jgi:hypothetical protein